MSPLFSDRLRSRFASGSLLGRGRNPAQDSGAPRRSKPTSASIRWTPIQLAEAELARDHGRPHELFVHQSALRAAATHLAEWGDRFGFLLGRRYAAPEDGLPWVEISHVVPASVALPGRGELPRFRLLRESAAREGARRKLELLGWYHQHRLLGLALTDLDVELHRANFPDPWQCALVLVSGAPEPAGAFMQPWDGQPYFKRTVVSFQEVSERDVPAGDAAVTCVDWSNYRPSRAVRLERSEIDGGWRPARRQPTHGGEELAAESRGSPETSADPEPDADPKPPAQPGDAPAASFGEPAPAAGKPAPAERESARKPPAAGEPAAARKPPTAGEPAAVEKAVSGEARGAPLTDESNSVDTGAPSRPQEPSRARRHRTSRHAAAPPGSPQLLYSWHRFLADGGPKKEETSRAEEPRGPESTAGREATPGPEGKTGPMEPPAGDGSGEVRPSASLHPGDPRGAAHGPPRRSSPGPVAEAGLLLLPNDPPAGLRDRLRAWLGRRRPRG